MSSLSVDAAVLVALTFWGGVVLGYLIARIEDWITGETPHA